MPKTLYAVYTLCVLSVNSQVGSEANADLDKLLTKFNDIQYKGKFMLVN